MYAYCQPLNFLILIFIRSCFFGLHSIYHMAFFLFFLILSLFPSSSSSSYVPPTNAIRLRGGGLMSNLRNEKNKAIDLALNNTNLFYGPLLSCTSNPQCLLPCLRKPDPDTDHTQKYHTPASLTHTHPPSPPTQKRHAPKSPSTSIRLKQKTKTPFLVAVLGSRFACLFP